MAAIALGIDIGGTFTDVVAFERDTGRQVSRKVLTSHDDPARAVRRLLCLPSVGRRLSKRERASNEHLDGCRRDWIRDQ